MTRLLPFIAGLLFSLVACAQTAAPNKALHALFEREFKYNLAESPEYATFIGVDEFNDRLTDRSPAAIARRKAHAKGLIRELERFDPKRLNAADRVSHALMLETVRRRVAFDDLYGALPFSGLGGWLFVSRSWGPQHSLTWLAKVTPFRHTLDYEKYLQRLAAVPHAFEQMTALMREAMRAGWMPPAEAMALVPAQFDPLLVEDPRANPLFAPFQAFPVGITAADQARLEAAGRKVLAEQVRPAFARLRHFVEQEYVPACRKSIAASALPSGAAYYTLAVRDMTTTTLAPAEIHALGLREVARIQGEMDRLVASIGFQGTRGEFAQAIRTDKRFYFSHPDDMLKAYRDLAKRVDAELPKLFAELPRLPYGIRAMEANEGDNAEHYTPGALDGSRAGFFEANVHSLATRPSYDLENTFLHEAVPGHHLQTARAAELKNLPRFRRVAEYVAYSEGWGLYAESLGPELGLYKDPYSRFGALSWEMMRACRLVVDTGMHVYGWTREQSIRYLVENAGIAENFAAAEVDRYIITPAQALAYKIGELKLQQLKARAQAALGEFFDIRTFHNAVLDDGELPLTVLEARIDEWIALQARAARTRGKAKETR
jgi:uncharacterized protein (DUF885 family)